MKRSGRCPKCNDERVWFLPAAHPGELMSISDPRVRGFETYACERCGYCEYYAVNVPKFEKYGGHIARPDETGPYR